MPQQKIRLIHLLYGVITAVLVLIMAIALIVSCISIYHSGDRPFSRDVIAQAFQTLAVPGWLCLIAVLGGILLHIFLPVEAQKPSAARSDRELLARYQPGFNQLPERVQAQVLALQKHRKFRKICVWTLSAILSLFPIIYYADVSHFGVSNITADVVKAIMVLLIPLAVVFLAVLWRLHLDAAGIRSEIALYKENGIKPGQPERPKKRSLTALRWIIAAAALVCILLGVLNEGYVDVLGKAIKICTECIGLG